MFLISCISEHYTCIHNTRVTFQLQSFNQMPICCFHTHQHLEDDEEDEDDEEGDDDDESDTNDDELDTDMLDERDSGDDAG